VFARFYRMSGRLAGANQRAETFAENNLCHKLFQPNGPHPRKQ
jgi:hypothetical protein